jgi:hypothetical protein
MLRPTQLGNWGAEVVRRALRLRRRLSSGACLPDDYKDEAEIRLMPHRIAEGTSVDMISGRSRLAPTTTSFRSVSRGSRLVAIAILARLRSSWSRRASQGWFRRRSRSPMRGRIRVQRRETRATSAGPERDASRRSGDLHRTGTLRLANQIGVGGRVPAVRRGPAPVAQGQPPRRVSAVDD